MRIRYLKGTFSRWDKATDDPSPFGYHVTCRYTFTGNQRVTFRTYELAPSTGGWVNLSLI